MEDQNRVMRFAFYCCCISYLTRAIFLLGEFGFSLFILILSGYEIPECNYSFGVVTVKSYLLSAAIIMLLSMCMSTIIYCANCADILYGEESYFTGDCRLVYSIIFVPIHSIMIIIGAVLIFHYNITCIYQDDIYIYAIVIWTITLCDLLGSFIRFLLYRGNKYIKRKIENLDTQSSSRNAVHNTSVRKTSVRNTTRREDPPPYTP